MSIGAFTARSRGSQMAFSSTRWTTTLRPCSKCLLQLEQGATISTAVGVGRILRITQGRAVAVTCFADATSGTVTRCSLSTNVAQKCLLIEAISLEKRQRIIITGVRQQSPAWEAGIRPGDELLGISDPNLETVWEFDEMTSLRFVKDALRMRIPDTVTLLINKHPTPLGGVAGDITDSADSQGTRAPPESSGGQPGYLDAVLSSVESDDSDVEVPSNDDVTSELERQYRKMMVEKTRSTERIQARKAALSTVSERNDAPFFLTIAAVFLGPPMVILLWAFGSGYLDTLSSMY